MVAGPGTSTGRGSSWCGTGTDKLQLRRWRALSKLHFTTTSSYSTVTWTPQLATKMRASLLERSLAVAAFSPSPPVAARSAIRTTASARRSSTCIYVKSRGPTACRNFSSSRRLTQEQRVFLDGKSERIEVLRNVPAVETARREWHGSTALVPTMGALHEGHLSLVRAAAKENENVVISIFVNPTQFGVNEDLDNYPRTWDSDIAMLHTLNEELEKDGLKGRVTAVFAPSTKVMYPTLPPTSELTGHGSFVTITPLGSILEGASRPVFFRGVATVCMKLFNIIRPQGVFFGQKDAQQCAIIKRLVKDFHLPIQVNIVPTTRESDGLAMSSRNVNLGTRRRKAALALYSSLRQAEQGYLEQGILERKALLKAANEELARWHQREQAKSPSERALSQLDYISIADSDTMDEVEQIDPDKGAILSGALRMLPLEDIQIGEDVGANGEGKGIVRLIDNMALPPTRLK